MGSGQWHSQQIKGVGGDRWEGQGQRSRGQRDVDRHGNELETWRPHANNIGHASASTMDV